MPRCVPVGVVEGARDSAGKKVPGEGPYFARVAHLKGVDDMGKRVALYDNEGGKGVPVTWVAPRHVVRQ